MSVFQTENVIFCGFSHNAVFFTLFFRVCFFFRCVIRIQWIRTKLHIQLVTVLLVHWASDPAALTGFKWSEKVVFLFACVIGWRVTNHLLCCFNAVWFFHFPEMIDLLLPVFYSSRQWTIPFFAVCRKNPLESGAQIWLFAIRWKTVCSVNRER